MKTDTLFYELFQFDPQSLFELVHLNIKEEYIFESITVKSTEKRFDGFFKSKDGTGPHFFLEVQGYEDSKIYWRLFREICTYYELKDDSTEFIALVLFFDKDYDPGTVSLSCTAPNCLIVVYLLDVLELLKDRASPLTVLKPLIFKEKKKLVQAVQQWQSEINSLNLTQEKASKLLELLEYSILQRFPRLTLKEVQTMLQLTPLEQTVAGQQLFTKGKDEGKDEGRKEGQKKGRKEGRVQGELIGQIRLAQRLLKQPITSRQELAQKSIEELQSIFSQLETELD